MDLTTKQQIFILGCMLCLGGLNHLLGVSKGLFIATLHRKEIDEFVKYMESHDENDEGLNELIENILEKKQNEDNNDE